jgi:signal transduction histidine kinase/ActR/RegA family two-component response regulator
MPSLSEIARLNVLIELFSECANAGDLESLLQNAGGRLRWVIEFDRCTFVLKREGQRVAWLVTKTDETPTNVAFVDLPPEDAALVERVLESGAPAAGPRSRMGIPLAVAGRTLGAICFSFEGGSYTYRDIRLGHHAGSFLGSLISRMDLEREAQLLIKRKDDLLALLSHELRNPLAPIVTAVHVLKMRADGQPTRELDVIERQTQHLVRLLDDLLDVARVTRGKTSLKRTPTEISVIVGRAVEMMGPLFAVRRHALEVKVPVSGLVVDADENRLAQVVSNLLSNAAHYTDIGGHIGIVARRDGDAVVLEVSDDGMGIPAEAQSGIFEPFVQGSKRASGQGGLGLGLVVVKQFTELHGGSISVTSAGDGRGTKFTVRLPLSSSGPALTSPSPGLVPRTDKPERVLLVDDNEDALNVLSTFVGDAGHEVAVAHDGAEAFAIFERFHPSVAVIDISMPVMGGHELAEKIRAHRSGAGPYLIALTGFSQPTDRERSRAAGFDGHLVKPVDLAHLLHLIAGVQSRSVKPSESARDGAGRSSS